MVSILKPLGPKSAHIQRGGEMRLQDLPATLSISQAAEILGVGRDLAYQAARRGSGGRGFESLPARITKTAL